MDKREHREHREHSENRKLDPKTIKNMSYSTLLGIRGRWKAEGAKMKMCSTLVHRGALLALMLAAAFSGIAWAKHNKTSTGIAFAREDGGRVDLIRNPENSENGRINFLGQKIGHYKYLIVRKPGDRAYIAAYYKGRHLFSVADEEVGIDGGGDWEPGEADNGYDFYMSPDRRYLFVDRMLISHLDVGLLYKKTDKGWIASGPTRFDDAALQAFCRSRHLNPEDLAGPSRTVRILKWDMRRGTLDFYMAAASFWFSDKAEPGDIGAEWTASCRLRDMRFRILSGNVYRFRKPGSFPWNDWPKSVLH